MKIRNVLIALALVAAPSVAQAQICAASPCARDMIATGTVQSSVTVNLSRSLDFGIMTTGANTVALGASTDGAFEILSNTDVNVTVAAPSDLSDGLGNNVALTTSCGYGAASAFATGDATFACATGSAIAFSAPGTAYVYVGGSATVAATNPAGVYSGTITMTTTYNSF